MSFTQIEPSETLIEAFVQIYIKYIEQENKFDEIFNKIENVIKTAKEEIDKSGTTNIYCSNYKDTFINKLKEFKVIDNFDYSDIKDAAILLINHLLKIADTFTYTYLTNPYTCIQNYYEALIDNIKLIKETIKGKISSNPIKTVSSNPIQMVSNNTIEIMHKHIKNDPKVKDFIEYEKYISNIVDLDSNSNITLEQIIDILKEKYNEFLSISPIVFTQDIKNKIKKSVIEIVSIELQLQKNLKLKEYLPFTNAVNKFLNDAY